MLQFGETLTVEFRDDTLDADETSFGLSDICKSCREALVSAEYADADGSQRAQIIKIRRYLLDSWEGARITLEVFDDTTHHLQRGCDVCGDGRLCDMYDVLITEG